MVKASCYNKNGVIKKGAWSEDEDNKLKAYIQRYGHWNWGLLPKFAGVYRSGKSCRLRWMNYLRPNIKHGNFTKEEDNIIIDLHNKLANKWSTIASKLPGRSDNEIKNRWNTHLKKQFQHFQNVSINKDSEKEKDLKFQQLSVSCDQSPSSSSGTQLSSSQLSGSDYAVSSDFKLPQTCDEELLDSFWTEPFLTDNDGITPSSDNLLSSFNFFEDFTICPISSCQDMMMTNEFLWSTLDAYVEDVQYGVH